MLLTFIYTRCPLPNFCPLMDRHFAKLQQAVAADAALRARVKLVSVSFDPEHDTPAVLAAHAERLKADPGDLDVPDRRSGDGRSICRPHGRRRDAAGRRPEITHNLRTVLIGADGKIVRIYSGNEWTPSKVLDDLRAAVAARRP